MIKKPIYHIKDLFILFKHITQNHIMKVILFQQYNITMKLIKTNCHFSHWRNGVLTIFNLFAPKACVFAYRICELLFWAVFNWFFRWDIVWTSFNFNSILRSYKLILLIFVINWKSYFILDIDYESLEAR